MKKAFEYISLTLLLSMYIFTRLANITIMNEYVDYDEGTYILIARLINHGFLPYRDIFAVHPPLYYYLLALWLRVFGDNLVVGRALSVFLGGIAVIFAYLSGYKLKNWKLGLLFAGIATLDPTFIRINMLVLHDTLIETFTVISLYFFVKYLTEDYNIRWARISLAIAAAGTSAKFTMIPYLVALFISIILIKDRQVRGYLSSAIDVLFSSKQVFLLMMLYLLLTTIFVSIVSAWPTTTTRNILVVLGIHSPTVIGHQYLALFIVVGWLLLTIYIFRCTYLRKLLHTIRIIVANWQDVILFSVVVLFSKAVIELPLGYALSENYISQTYFSQGSRYPFFVGIFAMSSDIIKNLSGNTQDLLVGFVPSFLLLGILLLLYLKNQNITKNYPLMLLFLLNMFFYLFLFPVIPNLRFINPLLIVFYLLVLDALMSVFESISQRTILVGILSAFTLLALVEYGMLVNYPEGKLNLTWALHTNNLREDLKLHIPPGKCSRIFSVNPMNTYYLNLQTTPWAVDSFGLLYLHKKPADELFQNLTNDGVKCFIFSTWVGAIMKKDPSLRASYLSFYRAVLKDGSLFFAESYSGDEFISLFLMESYPTQTPLWITSRDGKVVLADNNLTTLLYIFPQRADIAFKFKNVLYRTAPSKFDAAWYTDAGHSVHATILANKTSFHITTYSNVSFVLSFDGVATDAKGNILHLNSTISTANLYIGNYKLVISGPIRYSTTGVFEINGNFTITEG